ncbi:hypothetical protein PR048_020692 [Dryococelus australis]|uniref:Reverse transcriptase domain-containing protein n=1 Tax=Dryococelus australis TaxID=614101 RepID=A0ABQ9H6X3_9NEOP|nr:hypothetical protein PR048_020692 [Dryococelus australis]
MLENYVVGSKRILFSQARRRGREKVQTIRMLNEDGRVVERKQEEKELWAKYFKKFLSPDVEGPDETQLQMMRELYGNRIRLAEWFEQTNGVTQGSALSPLLFTSNVGNYYEEIDDTELKQTETFKYLGSMGKLEEEALRRGHMSHYVHIVTYAAET